MGVAHAEGHRAGARQTRTARRTPRPPRPQRPHLRGHGRVVRAAVQELHAVGLERLERSSPGRAHELDAGQIVRALDDVRDERPLAVVLEDPARAAEDRHGDDEVSVDGIEAHRARRHDPGDEGRGGRLVLHDPARDLRVRPGEDRRRRRREGVRDRSVVQIAVRREREGTRGSGERGDQGRRPGREVEPADLVAAAEAAHGRAHEHVTGVLEDGVEVVVDVRDHGRARAAEVGAVDLPAAALADQRVGRRRIREDEAREDLARDRPEDADRRAVFGDELHRRAVEVDAVSVGQRRAGVEDADRARDAEGKARDGRVLGR